MKIKYENVKVKELKLFENMNVVLDGDKQEVIVTPKNTIEIICII
jgi:hypothetical protein